MTNKRRTEITIETHSLTIVRTRDNGRSNSVYCRDCQKNVTTFPRAHAALIFRADVGELEHLVQTRMIHNADDAALCGSSLADFYNKEIRYVED